MTGEVEILSAIVARLDALLLACDEDQNALGQCPASLADFKAMPAERRVASRALLKTIEQLEDQLARLFRLLPKLMLMDTIGWYALDYANFAEKLGILEDGLGWTEIVRLRNRLAHDYPLTSDAQFDALTKANGAVPVLRAAASAARAFSAEKGSFQ